MNIRKDKRSRIKIIISLIGMITIIIVVFFHFINVNSNYVTLQNEKYIQDCTIQTADRINDILEYSLNNIKSISAVYSLKMTGNKVNYKDFSKLKSTSSFDYLEFADKNGICITSSEKKVDVSSQNYFLNGMKGKSGIDVVFNSKVINETLIVFYTPLEYKEKIIGVVLGYIKTDCINKALKNTLLNDNSESFLCTKNGDIIYAATQLEASENTDNIFENTGYIGSDAALEIYKAFKNGTSMSFTFNGTGTKSIGYITSVDNSSWILAQTFSSDIITNILYNSDLKFMVLDIGLIIIFWVYVITVLIQTNNQKKKLQNKNNEMSYVIDGVTQLFDSFVLVDFETCTYQYLVDNEAQFHKIPAKGDYNQLADFLTSMIIDNEEKEHIGYSLNKEQVCKDINKKNKNIRYEYRIMYDSPQWEYLNLICIEEKEDVPVKFLYTRQNVTAVKEEQQRNHLALKEAFKAAEVASKAKSEFLSRMSHDMRTPMNGIMGMTTIALMHVNNPQRITDCLDKISISSSHLLKLINEVLDMSKIESGKESLNEDEFNIRETSQNVIDMIKPQSVAKDITITLNTSGIVHQQVVGDSKRLHQIFINIAGNAIKFTPSGGHISITLSESVLNDTDRSYYKFVCEDNGIGMTKETIERIFEPFYRGNNSLIEHIEGTGLGMPIVKNLVHMMHGNIKIESTYRKGSKFTVTFYLKTMDNNAYIADGDAQNRDIFSQCEKVAINKLRSKVYNGKHILLVEDNELNMQIIEELIQEMGVLVEKAYNGKEAVEKLMNAPKYYYSLVFMDVNMPIMNGYEATQTIRKSDRKDLRKIPIIALTADAFEGDCEHALQAGMNQHITKPIDINKLITVFENWIE